MKPGFLIFAPVAFLLAAPVGAAERALTFEDRLEAQRAIERVYYSHQLGANLPFEQAVPDEVIRRKVARYLQQSVALEEYWHQELTPRDLQNELDRIASRTRLPDRLQEIYKALGDDPVIVQECFVRPILVDRLAREKFSGDVRIHSPARMEADQLREALVAGDFDPRAESPRRRVQEVKLGVKSQVDLADEQSVRLVSNEQFERLRRSAPRSVGEIGPLEDQGDGFVIKVLLDESPDRFELASFSTPKVSWDEWWASARRRFDPSRARVVAPQEATLTPPRNELESSACGLDDTWDNGALDDLPDASDDHTTAWTGSVMIVWGGSTLGGGSFGRGSLYDPATDSWNSTSRAKAPTGRTGHTAVWTGTEMIVWGGRRGGSGPVNDGGRYDPLNDIWHPLSTSGAPAARYGHKAVWTGGRMIVWGGTNGTYLSSGAAYEPATESWSSTSTANAPTGRERHTVVWTGAAMVVWGGFNGAPLGDGGRYFPTTDTWSPVSGLNAPAPRDGHTAVWTGSGMIVWGGFDEQFEYFSTGARYDPAADTWVPTSVAGAPSGRSNHSAVWTGTRMVIWGGWNNISISNSGSRYNPVTDSWFATSLTGAPLGRSSHSAVWTGSLMVVWGGASFFESSNLPGRYDPQADLWLPNSTDYPPDGRAGHRSGWTGNLMLVWGATDDDPAGINQGGGRYDPLTDTWTLMSRVNEPQGRVDFTAIWSGQEMIVWGGYTGAPGPATWHNSGGRYDPVSDTWQATSTSGAPVGRSHHTAVWTGGEMLVWGGVSAPPTTFLDSGGRYDPSSDSWTAMTSGGVPLGRYAHASVWSGQEMIVWGGYNSGVYVISGGRYNPSTDSWIPTSTQNAPAGRFFFPAVWTGKEMIIWGGNNGSVLNSGGRYDPVSDRWNPTSLVGAPSARQYHALVWTGSLAVVWGGESSTGIPSSQARYDPVSDSWSPVSAVDEPVRRSRHTAVWSGRAMMVWGGTYGGSGLYSGGRYIVAPAVDNDGDGVMVCAGDCDDADASTYPGAPPICDVRNNDCGDPGWPSVTGTNEFDDDGDALSECAGDCDDANGSAWSSPGEVPNLALIADGSTLAWVPPGVIGAASVRYDALRSPAGDDFSGFAICVESDDGTDTLATDGDAPVAGQIFYYLVRAENACPEASGVGPLGFASNGTPRVGRSCP